MDYLELRLLIRFTEPLRLNDNLASAVRGIWGRCLKKTYCLQRNITCEQCELHNCTYYTLFEKRFSANEQYHPYIIQSIRNDNNSVGVVFKFIGWTCKHIGKLLQTVLDLQKYPLVQLDIPIGFSIERILDIENKEVFKAGNRNIRQPSTLKLAYEPEKIKDLNLLFVTPYRQKEQKHLLKDFVWDAFFNSLHRRIRFFDTVFNNGGLDLPETIDAGGVTVRQSEMRWEEFHRKSARQQTSMSLGGLVGKVTLRNLSPEQYAIVKLGSYLHAGRQTSFGNGKYYIEKTG